jgi:Holliday junction resolvase-like predicted endonuclease
LLSKKLAGVLLATSANEHRKGEPMSDIEPKAIAAGAQNVPTVIEAKAVQHASREAPLDALELKNRLMIRTSICWFLMAALGYSVYCCFDLISLYLQTGHQISERFLQGLCAATIAQVGVFLGVFVRAVWPKSENNPIKPARN